MVPLKGGSPGCSEAISGGSCTRQSRAAPTGWGASRPRVGWRVARGPSGSGLIGPGSGLRTRAALCTASQASPPCFFGTHCLPFPVILSARGRGSPLTAHLPAPAARSSVGGPFAGESVSSKSGPAGAAWEDGLQSPRHSAPGDCCVCPPTTAQRGACLPCRHQLPTSFGLQSWRSGWLKDHRTQS